KLLDLMRQRLRLSALQPSHGASVSSLNGESAEWTHAQLECRSSDRRQTWPYWLFACPITPQATRAPESPAGCDLRSSAFAWTTTERPRIERSSFASDM